MTGDEAFEEAHRLLKEHGLLLNAHLLRLAGQNEALYRQLRDRLIQKGYATDQAGMGVKAIVSAGSAKEGTPSEKSRDKTQEYAGAEPSSPFLSEDDHDAELQISFSESDFLPETRQRSKPVSPQPTSASPNEQRSRALSPETASPITLPFVSDGWHQLPRLSEMNLILSGALLLLVMIFSVSYLWQPKSEDSNTIYAEFQRYHSQMKDLRNRAVTDPGEWSRSLTQARSRVGTIVAGLKNRRSGASAEHPEKQELLWAGRDSLSTLLDSPQINKKEEQSLEEQFEAHMTEARRLMDGGSRAPLVKNTDSKNLPGAGKPYIPTADASPTVPLAK